MGLPPQFRARVASFGQRWCVAYALLYVVPFPFDNFPLDHLPGMSAGLDALRLPWNALVAWIGSTLQGTPLDVRSYPGTDNVQNYIGAACLVALAAVLAAAWPFVTGARELSSRALDRSRAYAALYLGAQLLVYGWGKLIPAQMPEPGPDRLIIPVGDMSPTGVLWTFMGVSAGYQMLCGLVEALGGALMFWRRTRPLGALLAIAATGHVVAPGARPLPRSAAADAQSPHCRHLAHPHEAPCAQSRRPPSKPAADRQEPRARAALA